MKILFGIPFLYPAIAYGGAARAAFHLAEHLQNLGNEVTVLTTDVWDEHSRYHPNGFRPPFEVVRVPNLNNYLAYRYQFHAPMGIIKHAERLISRSDVLHLHTFRNLMNDLLARAACKHKVPFILSGHGTIPRIERFLMIKRFYDMLIGSWQLKHAAGFLAVTGAEQRAMEAFGLGSAKIRVIPNGVDPPPAMRIGEFRKRFKIPAARKMVLFLGKISRLKGLQYVVRAMTMLSPDVLLVIAGNDAGFAANVRRLVAQLGIKGRVLWTGLLGDVERFEALYDADVTVYPTQKDVFGLVALESILAGTPVIVGSGNGCSEVIKTVGGGQAVPWGNPIALADAISDSLRNGKNIGELDHARKRLLETYHWPSVASKVAGYYNEILSTP